MLLLGGVAALALAVFGKFSLDVVQIIHDRKRRPEWPHDYSSLRSAGTEGSDSWTYHPPSSA